MPELPAQKRARFIEKLGLREYDAQVLTQTRAVASITKRWREVSGDPKTAANWVMGDLLGRSMRRARKLPSLPSARRIWANWWR